MTRQSRIHRDVVNRERLKKHIKLRDDRYKTMLTIKGKHYYEEKYDKVLWSLLHSFIKRV